MTNEEKVRRALAGVLTNVMNYPDTSGAQLLGRDMSEVIDKATEAVMGTDVIEKTDRLYFRPLVNRVEVIDDTGRAYTNYQAAGVMTSLQDDGKTLKVFTKNGKVEPDGT